ncbi:ATP-binding protein [Ignatzschineria sp. LJL83]
MNLKKRLIMTISAILFLAWLVITLAVWHETTEQMAIITDMGLTDHEKVIQIQFEIKEIFIAVTVPIFIIMGISILLIALFTDRFLKPLIEIADQLKTKSDLSLITLKSSMHSQEAEIISIRLNELLKRIHQRFEYEKQFTADVAHELRTPLAGIRLNLELMDDVPEKQLLLSRIDDLLVTIEQLLQFSRASYELNSSNARVFNLFQNIVIPLKAEYEEDFPHPIQWDVPEDLMLKGDPSLIYLLLKNLLDNVKFYAGKGQETTVSFKKIKDKVVLEVIDNGDGIDESALLHITERYKRVDQSRKGFGLGLNLVERIASVHQAQLQIHNRRDGKTGLHITVFFKD